MDEYSKSFQIMCRSPSDFEQSHCILWTHEPHVQNENGTSRYYFSIIVEFKHPASLLQSLTKVKGKIKRFFEIKTTFKLLIVTSSDIFFLMFVGFLSRHFCKLIDYTTMYVHLWSACLIVRLRVTPLVLN